jgi:heme-binding protein
MKKAILAMAALILMIQLIPIRPSNPPERSPLAITGDAGEILTRSCFDCHSNKTRWPWYSRIAPVSWWVIDHVEEGREHLNFSDWGLLSEEDRAEALEEIVEEVEEREMPLPSYLPMHPEAELSASDIAALRAWATEQSGHATHEPEEHHE